MRRTVSQPKGRVGLNSATDVTGFGVNATYFHLQSMDLIQISTSSP